MILLPTRDIKESLCVSENVDLLTAEEERLFLRLTTKADDYGRYDGRAKVIRGAVFPLKEETITLTQVEEWLQRLASQEVDLIRFYQDRGVRYLYFVSWEKHQGKPRAKTSKYPQPNPENTNMPLAGAGMCAQMPANVPDLRSSDLDLRRSKDLKDLKDLSSPDGDAIPVDKPKKARKTKRSKGVIEYTAEFERVYAPYPRKVGKYEAFKAYQNIANPRPIDDELIAAIKRLKRWTEAKKASNEFAPDYCHPATWLNQRRWEDEYGGDDAAKEKPRIVSGRPCGCVGMTLLNKRDSEGRTIALVCNICGHASVEYRYE